MLFPCGNTNHLSLAKSDLLAFHDFGGLPAQGHEHGFSILVKMIRDFAARWEQSKKPAQVIEQVLAGQDLNPVRFPWMRVAQGQKVRGLEMFHRGSFQEMESHVLKEYGDTGSGGLWLNRSDVQMVHN